MSDIDLFCTDLGNLLKHNFEKKQPTYKLVSNDIMNYWNIQEDFNNCITKILQHINIKYQKKIQKDHLAQSQFENICKEANISGQHMMALNDSFDKTLKYLEKSNNGLSILNYNRKLVFLYNQILCLIQNTLDNIIMKIREGKNLW
jgi:hypothetical protein